MIRCHLHDVRGGNVLRRGGKGFHASCVPPPFLLLIKRGKYPVHGDETVHELRLPEQIVEHLQYWLEEFQPGSDRLHNEFKIRSPTKSVLMKSPTRSVNVSRQGTGSDYSAFMLCCAD